MTFAVTFDPRYKIWEAAAPNDARPVLACVLVDPSGVLVATDGFVLGLVKADVGGLDQPVLVKAEAFEAAATSRLHADSVSLVLNTAKQQCSVNMESHIRTWPFFAVVFPSWRPLVPYLTKLTDGIPVGGYSAALMLKAAAVTGGTGVTGGGQGKTSSFVVVDMAGKALAVVMPMFYQESQVMGALRDAYKNLGITAAPTVPAAN